jgi:hypothetical protein
LKNREQKIQQTEREKKSRDNMRAERVCRRHQSEKQKREQKARRRSRHGDAKFGARRIGRVPETGQAAEWMQTNFQNLNAFHPRGDGVGVFVQKNRSEKNEGRGESENKTRQMILQLRLNAAARNPAH